MLKLMAPRLTVAPRRERKRRRTKPPPHGTRKNQHKSAPAASCSHTHRAGSIYRRGMAKKKRNEMRPPILSPQPPEIVAGLPWEAEGENMRSAAENDITKLILLR